MQASSPLIFGCMSIGGSWENTPLTQADRHQAFALLDTSLQLGFTQFDHADIYKHGKAEQVFGEFISSAEVAREQLFIQSKCGIQLPDGNKGTRYNLSKEWIIESCEQTLSRLKLDYLDSYLLHRPDPLMQPDDIAEAFDALYQSGKVKRFGASNMSAQQLAFINSSLSDATRLQYNQLELNLFNCEWLDACVDFNCNISSSLRTEVYHTLLYCKNQGIQVQAWGSLAQGNFSKPDLAPKKQACRLLLNKLAQEYDCDINALQLAWLLQLPFDISPIIGSTNPERIAACKRAEAIKLSREHWYELYAASRENPLP